MSLVADARGKVVVVDPILTPTCGAVGYSSVTPSPQRRRLAFALLHVIRAGSDRHRAFIAAHVLGWEELSNRSSCVRSAWVPPSPECPPR